MAKPIVDDEKAAAQYQKTYVVRSYRARLGGLALAFVMVGAVLYENQSPWWVWVNSVFHCFAMPHIAFWLASRSAQPREAERRNLLLDHYFTGFSMAALQFNLLPFVVSLSLTGMNTISGGGAKLLLRGMAMHAVGMGMGVLLLGWHWSPAPSLFTVMACVPLLVIHPFSVGYVAFQAVQRLNAKRIEFERLSQHDGLSNLFNRRHWEGMVRNEFARFGRLGEPAVLVLADLDHFKRINDQHGHAAGDEAIRRFANLLNRVLRTTDVCGRYGGEEFGILLPGTDMPAAQEVIERLRSELYINTLMDGAVVTASFGLVQLDRDMPSVEAWLKQVDQMLYLAKALGRDQLMDPATAARRTNPNVPSDGAPKNSLPTDSAA